MNLLLLLKAIATDASQRFQNAQEMFDALVAIENKILEDIVPKLKRVLLPMLI